MKVTTLVAICSIATAGAFTPTATSVRSSTELYEKKSLFRRIAEMDLFAPVSDQNDYGARNKKTLTTGSITPGKSYVPSGLTAAQYDKIRKEQEAAKAANYQRNVAKAGKFLDYTDFYKKRGTDIGQDWIKSVTRGHTMVKTKYDWSGETDTAASFATKGKGKGKK
eukprot:CAMPEP_0172480788 /NCGR_PEP_ID=MMETSP1066-20121228/6215_1 /TAXON_ID=671091 /ORGANISM="Coscinodiscus wailesii, Strain CCMP2513" /LENGTH=165 /DNA_ID=CAMNT_0013242459 /DNA_START=163 /DNA_END=660 /DNA_ORIENTATION=+